MTEPFDALPSLGGTRWLLVEVGGRLVPASDDDERAPHLALDLDESRVSGSGGCNRLLGSIELAEDALRFGPIATALVHCGDEAMALERALLDALEATTAYALEGSGLTLLDGDRVLARLEAATAVGA